VAFHTASVNGGDLEALQLATNLSGEAHFEMKSGCRYKGQIKDGKLHGSGKLTFPDNMVYQGTFCMNEITGRGVSHWA